MGLNDMLTAAARGHTGLHYVPSFNDFVSGAADDVETMELNRDHVETLAPQSTTAHHPSSNKVDNLPAMTSAIGDIHKVMIQAYCNCCEFLNSSAHINVD